jgi:uncharacterized protein with FMN-binding domain
MRKAQPQKQFNLSRTVRKYFVSAFVVFSFAAYAVHEHVGNTDPVDSPVTIVNKQSQVARANPLPSPSATAPAAPAVTAPASPTAVFTGVYRDGEYVGQAADAYFGLVQVKAVVQGGKITRVQFLDFPQDRRTSQRINSFATPRLVTEAIRAQNSQVDIISGATLTSEAFMESLQSALDSARN